MLNKRSEWYRPTVSIGPTVIGQSDYAFPDSIRLLRLRVNGIPWTRTSLEQIEDTVAGLGLIEYVSGSGVYAPVTDAAGALSIRLYPTPTTAGQTIAAEVIGKPPAFSTSAETATTVFPDDADRALLDYVCSIYFGSVEDNPAMRSYYMDRFDEKALELRRLRIGRLGRGPRRIPIIGVTS